MPGVTDLFATAREFLDVVAEAVATAPGGPISKQFVATGPPPWDCCPMIAVHAGGPDEASTLPLGTLDPGFRTVDFGLLELVSLTATILRCAPVVSSAGMPTSAEIESASATTLGDVWAVRNHLRTRRRAGTLFTRADGEPRECFFDSAVALNTSGGCAGWQVPIRVELDGYA